MKKVLSLLLCAALVTGCGMSKTGSGALIGTGAGAALGAGIGYLIGGNGQGAAIGAAIGTAVGAGTGALIGNKMDKKAAELAKLENAKVEKVTDMAPRPPDLRGAGRQAAALSAVGCQGPAAGAACGAAGAGG